MGRFRQTGQPVWLVFPRGRCTNHEAAIVLHYMHYNFARIHQTLRVTPAMEAGIANHVWTLEEIVGLLAKIRFGRKI